jgi:glycolate oxidase iron-sulfur subunit
MKTEFSERQLADPATAVSAQAIRKCVHCGFCTATCPTYVLLGDERDSPRGRIYLMKEMLEKEQAPTPQVVRHIDRCLSCLACTTTCPSGVDYMHLVDHARAYIEARHARPVSERLLRGMLAGVLPHRARFRWALRIGRVFSFLAPAFNSMPRTKPVGAMLSLARSVPAQSSRPRNLAQDSAASGAKRGRVLLMQGCAESVVRPEIRAATVRLLNRVGYDVLFARDEGCCGALVHHMGREAEALAFIKHTVDAWIRTIDSAENVTAIIVTASGCGTLIKDYGFALRNDAQYADKAARISALAKDISELLTPDDIRQDSSAARTRVAYHAACSLQHGQKIVAEPKRLLEAAGFDVHVPAEAHLCCGSAGTYNLLQPTLAAQLGERKASKLGALAPEAIATGNVGCAVQIASHSTVPVVHTVELLDWATGGPVPPAMSNETTRRSMPR